MTSEALFQQAMQHYSAQNNAAAIEALTRSAALGHPMATLYLAEQYFRQNHQQAFQFLLQQWEKGVPGTLHRLVTLKAFFTNDGILVDDLHLLHKEAINGHAESLLVLMHLTLNHPDHTYYAFKLKLVTPQLLEDLGFTVSIGENDIKAFDQTRIDNLLSFAMQTWKKHADFEPCLSISKCGIAYYKNVFSSLACRYYRLRLAPHLKPSMVHDPVTGKGIQNDVRTSDIVHVMPEYLDWFGLELDLIIEKLTGISRARGESMNLLRYKNGQEYKPHYDAIVGQGLQFDTILKNGGQRIKTAITYLSDGYQGGETLFPKLGTKIKANIGDVLVFNNLDEDGNVLRDSYHAGLPVTEGTKWILTKWIRESATNYGNVVYPKKVN